MWDDHNGPAHFVGELPIDMNSPPMIGEVARLTDRGFEFDVEITSVEGENLSGRVIRIGPDPAIEVLGVKLGDVVRFRPSQVQILYCDRT